MAEVLFEALADRHDVSGEPFRTSSRLVK